MKDRFFPGACFDDEDGFAQLRSSNLEVRDLAWEKMMNHYQAPLREETRSLLARHGQAADDDQIDDKVAYSWGCLWEQFPTIQTTTEAALYDWMLNVIEKRIDSERRRFDSRRIQSIRDLLHSSSLESMTDEELLDLLQQHADRPSVEDEYLSYEKCVQFSRILASVLEYDLTYWHRQLAAHWFLYRRSAKQIARSYQRTKLNNTLARAKLSFVIGLTTRLKHALDLTPDDQDLREFVLMVDAFRFADKDGDLNQSHPFLLYVQHVLPHPLPELTEPRWMQKLLAALRSDHR